MRKQITQRLWDEMKNDPWYIKLRRYIRVNILWVNICRSRWLWDSEYEHFIFSKIKYRVRQWFNPFLTGIKNIWYWLPVIWKDHDWDHGYMEYILLHKLKRMYARFLDPNQSYVNWNEEAAAKQLQALKLCIIILERMKTSFHWNVDSHFTQCSNIEGRDYEILYKLMGKYSQGWWD